MFLVLCFMINGLYYRPTLHFYRKIAVDPSLKAQCPDYALARTPSVFSAKDNRTVKLTLQDFILDCTANTDLLFKFSSNILDFRTSSLSS